MSRELEMKKRVMDELMAAMDHHNALGLRPVGEHNESDPKFAESEQLHKSEGDDVLEDERESEFDLQHSGEGGEPEDEDGDSDLSASIDASLKHLGAGIPKQRGVGSIRSQMKRYTTNK